MFAQEAISSLSPEQQRFAKVSAAIDWLREREREIENKKRKHLRWIMQITEWRRAEHKNKTKQAGAERNKSRAEFRNKPTQHEANRSESRQKQRTRRIRKLD